jgi:hypothetical protein
MRSVTAGMCGSAGGCLASVLGAWAGIVAGISLGAGSALAQPAPFVVPVEAVYLPAAGSPALQQPSVRWVSPSGGLAVRCEGSATRGVYVVDGPGAPGRLLLSPGAPAPGRPDLRIDSYSQESIDAAGRLRARLTLRDAFGMQVETGIVEVGRDGTTRLLLWSGNAAPSIAGASIAPLESPVFASSSDGWVMGVATIVGVGLLPSNNRVQYGIEPSGAARVLSRSGGLVEGWGTRTGFLLSQSEPTTSGVFQTTNRFAAAFVGGGGLVQATMAGGPVLWTLVQPGAVPVPLLRSDSTAAGMAAPATIERLDLIAAREDGRCVFVAASGAGATTQQVAYASRLAPQGFVHRELVRIGQSVVGMPAPYSVAAIATTANVNLAPNEAGDAFVLTTMSSAQVAGLGVIVRSREGFAPEAVIASGFTRVGVFAVNEILEAVSNAAGQLLARVRLDNGAVDIVSWDARRGLERVADGRFASIFGSQRRTYAMATSPVTRDGRFVVSVGSSACVAPCAVQGVYLVRVAPCSDIDFDNDGIFPSDDDLVRFLGVLAGADCVGCDSIDFNGDGIFPSDEDLLAYLRVLAGGVGC